MRSLILVVTAIVTGTAACGSDGTSLAGIYAIDAWNRNATSCADPGESQLGSGPTHFYIKTETFITEKFVNMKSCDSLEDCAMLAGDDDTIHLGQFATFDDGNDDDGWTYRNAFAFDFQGMCDGSVETGRLVEDATGVALRIEEIDVMFPVGSDPDDPCPEAAVEAAAQGQPCTSLETVHGTFVEDI